MKYEKDFEMGKKNGNLSKYDLLGELENFSLNKNIEGLEGAKIFWYQFRK